MKSLMLPALLALSLPATSQAYDKVAPVSTTLQDGDITLAVTDVTPRFLDFYGAAKEAEPDARFALWQERYGFAAVPPTPEGQAMARRLIDGAWPRYAAAMTTIEAGAAKMKPEPMPVLRSVMNILGLHEPFAMQLTVYVGGFEGNAFTMAQNGVPMVAVPVEMPVEERERVLRHELAHAVHIATANLPGGWERPLASVIVQEGLAMHTAQALLPGQPDRVYVEHAPGWFDKALADIPKILAGLRPDLASKDGQTVFRYTMGTGRTGLEREAYIAGWVVVGAMLEEGKTLAQIARIPEPEMAGVVDGVIARLQNDSAREDAGD